MRTSRMKRMAQGCLLAASLGVVSTAAFSATAGASKHKPAVEKPSGGTVSETGSTLLFPLFNLWSSGYSTTYPSVTIQTAGTGSGAGITGATTGTADIGASDAYLSPAELTAAPTLANIPLAISAQLITYNIPGVSAHLKLTGKVISSIYQGKVTNWNASAIASLNPTVTLPNLPIVTLHRSDSSGDTFLFSSFLSDTDPSGWGKSVGFNTLLTFPSAPGALGEMGNSGMVAECKVVSGCIAYIGISYLTQALQSGLGYAQLQNGAKQFELPTPATITAEAASFTSKTPASGTISLIYGKAKGGYPIVNYEYGVVNDKQSSSSTAKNIRSVLEWAVNLKDGNSASYLSQVNFQPLPAPIVAQSLKQIKKIK
jgi:phosphate transport system substrate-binding protein